MGLNRQCERALFTWLQRNAGSHDDTEGKRDPCNWPKIRCNDCTYGSTRNHSFSTKNAKPKRKTKRLLEEIKKREHGRPIRRRRRFPRRRLAFVG
jgi:hypothetical protein